jgi:hypothetical protein
MILLAPGDTLRATLAAAPATANPSFSFASADDGAARTLVPSKGVLNGTTPVDLVGAPDDGTNRVVRSGFLYNADSAAVTVTVDHFDGTTPRVLTAITLQPGYTLTLGDDGWRVTDTTGAEVEPGSATAGTFRKVVSFAFGDASPAPIFAAPAGCTDILARLVIDTPFDGVGAALKLGTSGSPELLIPAANNDPTTAAGYEAAPDVALSSGEAIVLTIVPGTGATQGAGRVIFDSIAA